MKVWERERDYPCLAHSRSPLLWPEMVYFNWKLAKQNKGKRIPEWGPFSPGAPVPLNNAYGRKWTAAVGPDQGTMVPAHSPTRAPSFITGLSIPPSLGNTGLGPDSSCWPLHTDPTHTPTTRRTTPHTHTTTYLYWTDTLHTCTHIHARQQAVNPIHTEIHVFLKSSAELSCIELFVS